MLQLREVEFQYNGGFQLGPIDLTIEPGDFLGILGPNGCGKTTLLRLMTRLVRPTGGGILSEGRPLDRIAPRELARRMAVISSEQYFEFPFPVEEIVTMGRFPFRGWRTDAEQERQIVHQAMEMADVLELRHRAISQLSSGERQRVVLARALAQQPQLLILDEPNAHLDIHHQLAIFRLLRFLNRERGLTVVVVLHDLTAAAAFCRSVILLRQGKIFGSGSPEQVIRTEALREVYQADVQVHPSPGAGFPQVSYWPD